MKVRTIINYCTIDQRFINTCIDSVRSISSEIVVTYTDCFYNGDPENLDLIQSTIEKNTDVNFVKIKYEENKMPDREWCCYSRIVGYNNSKSNEDYVLFLDSDEIIESSLCNEFIHSDQFIFGDDYKLQNYFYFREANYQAIQLEDSATLLYSKNLDIKNVLIADRTSLFDNSLNPKHRNTTYKGQVLMHHYSWVRTKEQMIKKATTWGHRHDRNWVELIEKEFSHDFNGTDFIHGYSYKILPTCAI